MTVIIVRNITTEPLPLDNLTVENRVLLPNIDVNLSTSNKVHEIQSDPQLRAYIANGWCVMNDGTRDLSQDEAVNVATTVVSTADIYSFYDSPEKELVAADDIFLVEDSDDGWRKKKVKSSNVIFLGKGSIIYTPERFIETGLATTKSTTPVELHGMSKTIEQDGNYEVVFNGQFACLRSQEVVLIAVYVDNEIIANTRRIIEAESYVVGQTDAALENLVIGQVLHIRWWTERGRSVIAEARSMRIRRYV
jgi:hypothetical protein